MYSLKYKVTTSCCDSEGRLKLYSALQMMQDCSEMWIDSVPMVKRYFAEQNMAQLLATRQVEVVRVPEYKEELTVTTSVYEVKPMFGFRNTFIYDAAMLPEERKARVRETQFPQDLQKAYELGKRLATDAKQG